MELTYCQFFPLIVVQWNHFLTKNNLNISTKSIHWSTRTKLWRRTIQRNSSIDLRLITLCKIIKWELLMLSLSTFVNTKTISFLHSCLSITSRSWLTKVWKFILFLVMKARFSDTHLIMTNGFLIIQMMVNIIGLTMDLFLSYEMNTAKSLKVQNLLQLMKMRQAIKYSKSSFMSIC